MILFLIKTTLDGTLPKRLSDFRPALFYFYSEFHLAFVFPAHFVMWSVAKADDEVWVANDLSFAGEQVVQDE